METAIGIVLVLGLIGVFCWLHAAWKDSDRRDAPGPAASFVPYEPPEKQIVYAPPSEALAVRRSFHSAVAGESHRNADGSSRQRILARARAGDPVDLVPEPGNPYDEEAVGVRLAASGEQIGYLPSGHRMSRDIAAGMIRATLAEVTGGTAGKRSLGAVLKIDVLA